MSTRRFTKGDALAVVAALALLLVTATDWYSSPEGEELRRIERLAEPDDSLGPEARDLGRQQQEEASQSAEAEERNAWTADGLIDRLILVALLAAAAAAVALASSRMRTRSMGVPGGARGLVLSVATLAAMLVTYRIVQEPGIDAVTTIRGGPFLALVTLGLMSLGAILTLRAGVDAEGDEAVAKREPERTVATADAEQHPDASSPVEPAPASGPVGAAPVATAPAETEMLTASAVPEAKMSPTAEAEAELPLAADPVEAEGPPPSGRPDAEVHAPPTAALADTPNGAAPVSYRRRFSANQRARIAAIARSDPSEAGKPFARWTHARLATHLVEEGVVDSISPGTVGRILRQEGVSGDPTSPG